MILLAWWYIPKNTIGSVCWWRDRVIGPALVTPTGWSEAESMHQFPVIIAADSAKQHRQHSAASDFCVWHFSGELYWWDDKAIPKSPPSTFFCQSLKHNWLWSSWEQGQDPVIEPMSSVDISSQLGRRHTFSQPSVLSLEGNSLLCGNGMNQDCYFTPCLIKDS